MPARRGRPPTGSISGKSSVFTTRIRPELREKLDEAAAKSGHSLSQEVERRLSDSFIQDKRIEDMFGDAEMFWLMRVISIAMQNTHVPFQKSGTWKTNPTHFQAVFRTVTGILESLRPGRPPKMSPIDKEIAEFTSKKVPLLIWQAIQDADANLPLDKGSNDDHLAALLKRKLGGMAEIALKRAGVAMPSDDEWKRRAEAAYEKQTQEIDEASNRRKK